MIRVRVEAVRNTNSAVGKRKSKELLSDKQEYAAIDYAKFIAALFVVGFLLEAYCRSKKEKSYNFMKNISIDLKNLFKYIGLIICFVINETFFRVQPEMQVRYVQVTDEVPILFDLFYGVVIVTLISMIPSVKKMKKIVYLSVYCFFCIFMFSQYIYCRIFDRVYGLKTLQYAGEGGDFAGMVVSYFDRSAIILLICFLVVGIIGWFLVPDFPIHLQRIQKIGCGIVIILGAIAGILFLPSKFMDVPEDDIGAYRYKKVIYDEWIDNKRAVSMFGTYEFLARDCYLFFQEEEVSQEELESVTAFFEGKKVNQANGMFAGKNLILVLMESMDDWLINEETTPTICKMMNEGINFTNMYTPIFGSAGTLNSEVCSYTGLLAPADETPLVNYTNNYYPYSLPNLFKKNGYTAKSFHYNSGEFYNRQNIHNSVGFEEYVSLLDYETDLIAQRDSTLVTNEEVYQKLVSNTPFFDFVITFSAHSTMGSSKPYSHEDDALKIYPEYLGKYESEEMDSISAKARLTDDMFSELLKALERDGILEDTVIIAYGDHYNYTIVDQEYLKDLSDSENVYELSKTPFFIWAKNIEHQEIDKVVNTTDIYPTICNLFHLDNAGYYFGNDVFDVNYEGYTYWQDGSWIKSNGAFYNDTGEILGSVSGQEQQKMSEMIFEILEINQLIFDTDFFRQVDRYNE